jgi:hypothetical protein
MIKAGLVNTKRGGGFEKGYPQQDYPKGRHEIVRPYVADDKTILEKSAYSTPADYKAITPSPVNYNDIFAKKATPDERLYILKQIQQGLDKIQKGILGKIPVSGPPVPTPSASQPTDETGQTIGAPPGGGPPGGGATGGEDPREMIVETPTTINDPTFPGVVDLGQEEIAEDVVQNTANPFANYDPERPGLPSFQNMEFEPQIDITPAIADDAYRRMMMHRAMENPLESLLEINPLTGDRPLAQIPNYYDNAKVEEVIHSNGSGPRSRSSSSRRSSNTSELTTISELQGRMLNSPAFSKSSLAALHLPDINTRNLSSDTQSGHIGDYGSGPTRLNEDVTISQMIPVVPRRNPPRTLAENLIAGKAKLKKATPMPKKKTESDIIKERLAKIRRRNSDSSYDGNW